MMSTPDDGLLDPRAIRVDPQTVNDVHRRLTGRGRGTSAAPDETAESRASGDLQGPVHDGEREDASVQLWETKRNIAAYLMSSMQEGADTMPVLILAASDGAAYMRSLTRFDLLLECRKSVPEDVIQQLPGAGLHLKHSRGAVLQLRDIRALQDVHHPSLMVRVGAIILSLAPLKAIITQERAFVVVPDGADSLFEPLLKRIRQETQTPNGAFEFVALEALLVTLVTYYRHEVQRSAGASLLDLACNSRKYRWTR